MLPCSPHICDILHCRQAVLPGPAATTRSRRGRCTRQLRKSQEWREWCCRTDTAAPRRPSRGLVHGRRAGLLLGRSALLGAPPPRRQCARERTRQAPSNGGAGVSARQATGSVTRRRTPRVRALHHGGRHSRAGGHPCWRSTLCSSSQHPGPFTRRPVRASASTGVSRPVSCGDSAARRRTSRAAGAVRYGSGRTGTPPDARRTDQPCVAGAGYLPLRRWRAPHASRLAPHACRQSYRPSSFARLVMCRKPSRLTDEGLQTRWDRSLELAGARRAQDYLSEPTRDSRASVVS